MKAVGVIMIIIVDIYDLKYLYFYYRFLLYQVD